MLAFLFVGIGLGVISKRWGPSGVWVLSIGGMVVIGGLAVLLSWLNAWPPIGTWLSDQSVTTLAVGLPVALAAVVAALGPTPALRRRGPAWHRAQPDSKPTA